jgi:hypothetical protein
VENSSWNTNTKEANPFMALQYTARMSASTPRATTLASRARLAAAAAAVAVSIPLAVAAAAATASAVPAHGPAVAWSAPAQYSPVTTPHRPHSHLSGSHSIALAAPSPNPSLAWLQSPGGQAQVTFNGDVTALAAALETESFASTDANHLLFETDARAVRAEARTILSSPDLLPAVNRGRYKEMLHDFINVADLLQPGPDYGTTAEDYTAWYTALGASDIVVS